MRALVLAAFLLAAPTAVTAQAITLGELAGEIHHRALAADVAAAPDGVVIDAALRDLLLAQTLDGGREQSVYLRYDPAAGTLTFDRAIPGVRYRATGRCEDCTYPQPVQVHTHPYENPFSVVDLRIAGRSGKASLMAARDGRLWLAVPTSGSGEVAADSWIDFRYALFGNRLQCPARTPAGGWASATPMARNVEIVARAAAHDLKVALYVLDPGQTRFRKLADFDPGEAMFGVDHPFALADLNPWEMALLRTLHISHAARERPGGVWTDRIPELDPSRPHPGFETAMAEAPDETDPSGVAGAPRNAANQTALAYLFWFEPLPTTVYLAPFKDIAGPKAPFASVQWSADCGDLLVLHGEQDFAAETIRYDGGWRRPARAAGGWREGWSAAGPQHFPAGQTVPW